MTYGNCFFGLWTLFLRRKVKAVVGLSSGSPYWPVHLAAVTPRGHVLHFNPVLEHKKNKLAPWWFLGKFSGVSRVFWNRRVVFVCRRPRLALAVLVVVTLVLLLPWVTGWALYPLFL